MDGPNASDSDKILECMDLLLPDSSLSPCAQGQPVLSPVTAALTLAHGGLSSPANSAKMVAQLNALDSLSKR